VHWEHKDEDAKRTISMVIDMHLHRLTGKVVIGRIHLLGGKREQPTVLALVQISTTHKQLSRLTDPLVMRFMDMLVYPRVVFQSMKNK
jgi:hypothetical protein